MCEEKLNQFSLNDRQAKISSLTGLLVEYRINFYGLEKNFSGNVTSFCKADLADPLLKLVVEIDGESHFISKHMKTKDETRTKILNLLGWQVIRFTNMEIDSDLSGCVEKIRNKMKQLSGDLPQKDFISSKQPSYFSGELIFKEDFLEKVGIPFNSLRLWAARNNLPALNAISTMSKNGSGRQQGLYSLARALDYKWKKAEQRIVGKPRPQGDLAHIALCTSSDEGFGECLRCKQINDDMAAKALREGGK